MSSIRPDSSLSTGPSSLPPTPEPPEKKGVFKTLGLTVKKIIPNFILKALRLTPGSRTVSAELLDREVEVMDMTKDQLTLLTKKQTGFIARIKRFLGFNTISEWKLGEGAFAFAQMGTMNNGFYVTKQSTGNAEIALADEYNMCDSLINEHTNNFDRTKELLEEARQSAANSEKNEQTALGHVAKLKSPYVAEVATTTEGHVTKYSGVGVDSLLATTDTGKKRKLLDGETYALPKKQAGSIFWQALQGLKAMHDADLSHGDFKFNNMTIDAGGNVRLIDFGLTRTGAEAPPKKLDSNRNPVEWRIKSTQTTPILLPPETGTHTGGAKQADMWAAGVTFATIFTGNSPLPGHFKQTLDDCKEGEHEQIVEQMRHFCAFHIRRIYGFPSDEYDFLLKMLEPDPVKRITVEGALNHPYMKQFETDELERKQATPVNKKL